MFENKSSSAKNLVELLGYEPEKAHKITKELFGEVIEEIKKDRIDVAKNKVKDLLVKAINLRKQADKAKKDFTAQMIKCDEELGKVMCSIDLLLSGEEPKEL